MVMEADDGSLTGKVIMSEGSRFGQSHTLGNQWLLLIVTHFHSLFLNLITKHAVSVFSTSLTAVRLYCWKSHPWQHCSQHTPMGTCPPRADFCFLLSSESFSQPRASTRTSLEVIPREKASEWGCAVRALLHPWALRSEQVPSLPLTVSEDHQAGGCVPYSEQCCAEQCWSQQPRTCPSACAYGLCVLLSSPPSKVCT